MAGPWASATPLHRAERWRDDTDVALFGRASGQATVSAAMHREQGLSGTAGGRATAGAHLTLFQLIAASSGGATAVSGILGFLKEMLGSSHGQASVSAQGVLIGQVEPMVAGSAGVSTAFWADLTVTEPWPPRPSGGHQPPVPDQSGARSNDKGGRNIFSPFSTGRTNGEVT